MKKTFPLLASLALAFAIVTPNASAQKGGVAIIDVDLIASELKVDQAVLSDLQAIEANLNGQLAQQQQQLQVQFDNARSQAGQAPTPQQQQALVNYNQQLNGQFNQVRTQAQQLLTTERINKINEFREKLSPIALEVAKEQNLHVVLSKTQQVFAFAEAVDITQAVLKAAKEAGMEAQVEAAPVVPTAPAIAEPAPAETPAPAAAPAAKGEKGE